VDRVTLLGSKLVDHATNAGTELVNWLTGLSANSKTLADKTADGLDEQTQDLADALKEYAEKVAEARRIYAVTLAEKTALHDRAVTAANETYKNNQAERERVRENAEDAAEWTYERLVADAWRDEVVIDDNHQNFWPRVTATEGSAGNTRDRAIAQISRDYAVGMATDQKDWVAAVGTIHVTLATDAKLAADTLAADLKTASDGLTSDQAAAAKELATDLATAEADYTSGNATLHAAHDDAAAGPDGQLQIGLTDVANLQREGQTRERGEYETDSYGRHSAALVATGSTSLIATGGTLSGPLGDLLGYQQQVAASDLAWSTGKETAQNNFESLLSDAYYAHATAEHGPGGSVPTHIHAAGEATKNRIIGLANSDKQLSIDSTENLADFTEDAQSAASKAARDGVAAETEYDVNRAEAKRVYHNAIAAAELARTTATADAQLAFTLGHPYPLPPDWLNSSAYQTLLATLTADLQDATADYDAAVKQAKIDHANAVGGKQILRATKLGDALKGEATETGDAEIGYVNSQNADDLAYENGKTPIEIAGTQGTAGADRDYAIVAETNSKNLRALIGAATEALSVEMRPHNVAHTTGVASAEGTYHSSMASRLASSYTTWASGFPTVSPQGFQAAQAAAESQWISSMSSAFTAFATAMTQAEEDETVSLVQATVAAENQRADADLAYVTASEPLYYNQRVNSTIAWREYIVGNGTTTTGETQRGGVLNLTRANHYKTLDESYADGAKAQAVTYATADKTYHVALLERGPLVVIPPELPPLIDPLDQDRRVSKANADLTKETDRGTADVTWTAGIVAGDDVYRTEHATGVKNYQSVLADIDRDFIVAQAPLDETHTLGYLAAQTAYWTAEVGAASARRTAESTAIANWRGADYGASAGAIGSIDTAMELPWTGYLADKAAAVAAWWTSDERDNFLALAAATNAAETAYQTTVNAAFTTWAPNTAAAETTFTIADANAGYDQQVLNFATDEAYEHALADAEGDWQNGRATNLATRRTQFWTDKRDAVVEQDTTFVELWELITMMPMPGDAEDDRAYTVAESTAHGTRRVAKATAWRDYVEDFNTAILPYVNTTATAAENYTIAESTAAAARTAAVAAAIASHDLLESQTLADAIEAFALASPTPWAAYASAVLDASEDYIAAVAPAWRDRMVAESAADRDFDISRATGQRVLGNARATASATLRLSVANADRSKAIDESTAETAGANVVPLPSHWAEIANASPSTSPPGGQGGGTSGGATEPTWSTATGCGCPDPRPATLPTKLTPYDPDQQFAIPLPESGTAPNPSGTIQLPLPAKVSEDETPDDYYSRSVRRPSDGLQPLGVPNDPAREFLQKFTVGQTPVALTPVFVELVPIYFIVIESSADIPVDVNWTDEQIRKEAMSRATGGEAGTWSTALELEVQRWIEVIRNEIRLKQQLAAMERFRNPPYEIYEKNGLSMIKIDGADFYLDDWDSKEDFLKEYVAMSAQERRWFAMNFSKQAEFGREFDRWALGPTWDEVIGRMRQDAPLVLTGLTFLEVAEPVLSRVDGTARIAGGVVVIIPSGGLILVGNVPGIAVGSLGVAWSVDQFQTGGREIIWGEYINSIGATVIHDALGDNFAGTAGGLAYDIGPPLVTMVPRTGLPAGGALSRPSRMARVVLEPVMERVGQLPRVSARGRSLRLSDYARRFVVQDTLSHPGVGDGRYAFAGKALKRLFPQIELDQHHWAIQARWFRAGSPSQWYPNNPLANAGLQRLGNAGWNLVPIPRGLNGLLGRSPWGTAGFAIVVVVGVGTEGYVVYQIIDVCWCDSE
jgi:hypothetical protein